MNKSTSRSKAADHSPATDQPKDGQPEPDSHTPENSINHNGSADAFGATEEVRDDEDSDEDNDDFARDYK
jgi:hypothetical protein